MGADPYSDRDEDSDGDSDGDPVNPLKTAWDMKIPLGWALLAAAILGGGSSTVMGLVSAKDQVQDVRIETLERDIKDIKSSLKEILTEVRRDRR